MKFSRLSDAVLNRNSVWAVLLVLIIFLYAGCGGNDGSQVLPNVTGADKVTSFGDLTKVTVKDMALTDKNADEYYDRLEKILNGEYSALAGGPQKAAGTPYLTNMVLSLKTDEVQALAAYDLATKITATANFSDGTTEIVMPTWMVYSGPAALVNNIYTAQAAAGQTVFIAYYTRDGVTRFAIFRLAVNSMSLLNLSLAADAVQASGNYDLNSITVYAKSSNGTSKDVTADPNTKWSLLSGRGTLNGNIYTAPAMADTAIFLVRYTEAGVIESAQFTLKINGLTSISLNKTTDEIQLPETYNLDSELIVTAKYSSGSTLEVTHLAGLTWALTSGSGTLAGTVYTPTAKVETAVFTGSYTESGITKTTTFQLKAIGLSSLSLNKTTDEVQSCANYSLADNLILTDKLSNGTTTNRTMDPNTKWTLVSGRGALNGMVYTAPALAETAVIAATYTEAGITKTINFRLRVNALVSLTLSKTTDETVISTPYDIASKLVVFAKFSNGQTKEVTTNQNLRWTISFGSGILNGAVYTTPERIETTVIVATYTENGVAQSARFSLKVSATAPGTKVLLIGLTINKTTDSVQLFDKTYDLGSLAATGKYSNGTTSEVTLSWIVTSGGGSVAGNIFTAPANVGTVQLMGSCTAEDGSVKSVYFTLKALNDTIDRVSALIGPEGGSLTLKNGVVLQIPQNSVITLSNITLVQYSYMSDENTYLYKITSDKQITEGLLFVPADQTAIKEYLTVSFITHNCDLFRLNVDLLNSKYVIHLKEAFSSTLKSSSMNRAPNRGSGTENFDFLFLTEEYKKINDYYNHDINKFSGEVNKINCAYYKQYYETCWAASLLSFVKTYGINLGNDFNTIYKLLRYYNKIDKKSTGPYFPFYTKKYNFLAAMHATVGYFWYEIDIPGIDFNAEIFKRTNIKFTEKYFANPYKFARYALICLSQRKPILLDMNQHAVIITGYESINNENIDINNIDLDNLLFIYNNSEYEKNHNTIFQKATITDIIKKWSPLYTDLVTTVHTPLYNNNSNHQTIQLPDGEEPNISNYVGFYYNTQPSFTENLYWDRDTTNGYGLNNSGKIEIYNSCTKLSIKSVPIGNATNSNDTIHVELAITGGNKNFRKWYEVKLSKDDITHFSEDISTSEFIDSSSDGQYNLSVSILNKDKKWLDSFDVNFIYRPLTISPTPKIEFAGNNIQLIATMGGKNVTNQATWTLSPYSNGADSIVIPYGLFKTADEITQPQDYYITATYKEGDNPIKKADPVKIKILPGIIPLKKAILPGQSFQFTFGTSINGTLAEHLTWQTGWYSLLDNITQDGLFTASTQTGYRTIQATLNKGTVLSSDEILESDLVSKSKIYVHDIYAQTNKNIIDCNENCRITLKDRQYEASGDFADKAEWSAEYGSFEKSGTEIYYKPVNSGSIIIKAKLKEKTPLPSGYLLEADLEITTEVTVVKIEVMNSEPITARIEPVNAEGKPISSFREEKEFSISVNGADVPIELPYATEGTITLVSTTAGPALPIIHTFKYTPPLSELPYYDNDSVLQIDIKSSEFATSSASTKIIVYKPQKSKTNTIFFYPSGNLRESFESICYTDIGSVMKHGVCNIWFDKPNSLFSNENYKFGQYFGIQRSYTETGILSEWYNYTTFNYATRYMYVYTNDYDENMYLIKPVTYTFCYSLTRASINGSFLLNNWSSTLISAHTTPGWAPPPPLPPPLNNNY